MKKILCFCLVVIFVMGTTINVSAIDTNVRASGECGENVIWSLDDSGVLTISGKGAINDMYHYTEEQPWYNRGWG